MKALPIILSLGLLLVPVGVGANDSCSQDGYTIVFVNGVFTDLGEA